MSEPELSIGAACDFAQSYVNRQVKPFEKIQQVLAVARKAEQLATEAEARRAKAEVETRQFQDELERLKRDETAAFHLTKESHDKERQRLSDEIAAQNKATAERLAELETIRGRAQREHDAVLDGFKREREDVERTTQAAIAKVKAELVNAEKAYDAFKKKVGMG